MPSSVISRFSYDIKAKSLKITFVSGMDYLYKSFPKQIFDQLNAANSKGSYFNQYIKEKFRIEKLGEE